MDGGGGAADAGAFVVVTVTSFVVATGAGIVGAFVVWARHGKAVRKKKQTIVFMFFSGVCAWLRVGGDSPR